MVAVLELLKIPPPLIAELPEMVEFETVAVLLPKKLEVLLMPPPSPEAVLPEMVEFEMLAVPLTL